MEPDEQSTASVLDFLYYDRDRVASFLSQFDESGHLTGLTSSESAGRSVVRSTQSEVKGGLPKLLEGGGAFKREHRTEQDKQSTRTYDPRWANARAFLDYLDERQLLHSDVEDARIGQIVLFSGELALFDLGVLRRMWELPSIKKLIIHSANEPKPEQFDHLSRKDRRRLHIDGQTKKDALPTEAEAALELLTILPHAIQAAVSTDQNSIWASLREENLTIAASDLFMKHGLTVEGLWSMVGILDALPDVDFIPREGGPSLSILKQMLAGSKLGSLAFHIAPGLIPAIRHTLGRPPTSYGVTPLVLYRKVSG